MLTSIPSSSSTSTKSDTTSTIRVFISDIAAPLIAHLSATRIILRRFFASSLAVSSSLGGKKIANAAFTLPQNDEVSASSPFSSICWRPPKVVSRPRRSSASYSALTTTLLRTDLTNLARVLACTERREGWIRSLLRLLAGAIGRRLGVRASRRGRYVRGGRVPHLETRRGRDREGRRGGYREHQSCLLR